MSETLACYLGDIFYMLYFFKSRFKFTVKLRERYKDSSYTPCPHMCINSSIMKISYQSAACVKIDEPAVTHQNNSKFIVYYQITHSRMLVHPWCCTFYGCGWHVPVILLCVHINRCSVPAAVRYRIVPLPVRNHWLPWYYEFFAIFSSVTFPFQVIYCVGVVERIKAHIFPNGKCNFSSTIWWNDCPFRLNYCGTFNKMQLSIYVWLYVWILFSIL